MFLTCDEAHSGCTSCESINVPPGKEIQSLSLELMRKSMEAEDSIGQVEVIKDITAWFPRKVDAC